MLGAFNTNPLQRDPRRLQIIVAGMGLPWLGYGFGYGIARIFRQPHVDALAISMETGVQNTGISIFLLRYALPQPQADLTTGKLTFKLHEVFFGYFFTSPFWLSQWALKLLR